MFHVQHKNAGRECKGYVEFAGYGKRPKKEDFPTLCRKCANVMHMSRLIDNL